MAELLVTMAIFTVLMTGVFGAYFSQLGHSTREYKVAESEIELGIAKRIIEQDLQMTGYGLAEEYPSPLTFNPKPVVFSDGGTSAPDQLYLKGTALGQKNRASQGWSYIEDSDSAIPEIEIKNWGDPREQLGDNDRVILIDPNSKVLLTDGGGSWLFKYTETGTPVVTDIVNLAGNTYADDSPQNGTLIYGLYRSSDHDDPLPNPYYTVYYHLGSTADSPGICADGTSSLLRAETVETDTPTGGDPLLDCVLDFQVAFGLDTTGDGMTDNLTNTASIINGLSRENMNDQLKRIKVYYLIQSGSRDNGYTYPLSTIRVGEGTSIGRVVTLTAEQRKYRWRLVTLSIEPKNVR